MMTAEVTPGPSSMVKKAVTESAEDDDNDDGGAGDIVPTKKAKIAAEEESDSNAGEKMKEYMDKTFDVRRSFITTQDPSIEQVKETYPNLFEDRQILLEFERITTFDLDHLIQQYCVKNSAAIIELAQSSPGSPSPLLRKSETIKQESPELKQYWDMVTSLCLLPHLLRENLVEMVIEVPEDGPVEPKGKIVPILVSKGSIFKSDEFFLVAEEQVVQEFEEFTIAFATLFATYWVFNMQYPQTLNYTYTFIQKVIINMKDSIPTPTPCKMLQQRIQKVARQQHSPKTK